MVAAAINHRQAIPAPNGAARPSALLLVFPSSFPRRELPSPFIGAVAVEGPSLCWSSPETKKKAGSAELSGHQSHAPRVKAPGGHTSFCRGEGGNKERKGKREEKILHVSTRLVSHLRICNDDGEAAGAMRRRRRGDTSRCSPAYACSVLRSPPS